MSSQQIMTNFSLTELKVVLFTSCCYKSFSKLYFRRRSACIKMIRPSKSFYPIPKPVYGTRGNYIITLKKKKKKMFRSIIVTSTCIFPSFNMIGYNNFHNSYKIVGFKFSHFLLLKSGRKFATNVGYVS